METVSSAKLHTIGQITLAAFLGSPLPGFWMASRNLRMLGKPDESRQSLGWGLGLTLLNLVLAFVAPESVPGVAISLPFVVVTRMLAERWLKPAIIQHRLDGGQFASWWIAVGCGLLSLVIILALIFGVLFVVDPSSFRSL